MKIYHTVARKDYRALMVELESKGYLWADGTSPTGINKWDTYKANTCISTDVDGVCFGFKAYYEEKYPDVPIIEYKAPIKTYHTQTQEDYDALMVELESKGYLWADKHAPSSINKWPEYEEHTYVKVDGIYLQYGSMRHFYQPDDPNEEIIEYKAKQENDDDKQDKLSPNHYKFGDMEVRHFLDRVFKYGEFDAVSAPYVSNAIEYICRAPRKEGIEDYKKALNNLKFLIEILEGKA